MPTSFYISFSLPESKIHGFLFLQSSSGYITGQQSPQISAIFLPGAKAVSANDVVRSSDSNECGGDDFLLLIRPTPSPFWEHWSPLRPRPSRGATKTLHCGLWLGDKEQTKTNHIELQMISCVWNLQSMLQFVSLDLPSGRNKKATFMQSHF